MLTSLWLWLAGATVVTVAILRLFTKKTGEWTLRGLYRRGLPTLNASHALDYGTRVERSARSALTAALIVSVIAFVLILVSQLVGAPDTLSMFVLFVPLVTVLPPVIVATIPERRGASSATPVTRLRLRDVIPWHLLVTFSASASLLAFVVVAGAVAELSGSVSGEEASRAHAGFGIAVATLIGAAITVVVARPLLRPVGAVEELHYRERLEALFTPGSQVLVSCAIVGSTALYPAVIDTVHEYRSAILDAEGWLMAISVLLMVALIVELISGLTRPVRLSTAARLELEAKSALDN